jgi:hypothetical protein
MNINGNDSNFDVQCKQKGVVWVEFVIVASFVLVSLFTLVPLLGKMIDTRHKVEQSARYASWERTVWLHNQPSYHPNSNIKKTNKEIQNEIHQRVFADPDAIIFSKQHLNLNLSNGRDMKFDPMQNFYNRSARSNQRYQTMLKKTEDVAGDDSFVTLTQTDNKPPSGLANAGGQIFSALGSLAKFNINTNGYYIGEVSVPIKEFSWFKEFQGIEPVFTAKTALLTDGWNAGGPDGATKRVKPLFPQDWIDGPITDTIQDVAGIFFRPLRSSSLKIGDVTIEPVPCGRIGDRSGRGDNC